MLYIESANKVHHRHIYTPFIVFDHTNI